MSETPVCCPVRRQGPWPFAPLLAPLLIPIIAALAGPLVRGAAGASGAGIAADTAPERDPPVAAGGVPDRAIAITLDDVPGVATLAGPCDAAALRDVNDRLLGALEAEGVPATAFVVGSQVCDSLRDDLLPELLARWKGAGHSLGNHTFTHRDLNQVPLDWYLADIDRNQRFLEPLQGPADPRWFRPPLLHTGDEASKRDGLRAYLDQNGYRMGPVTVDNQEWIFAEVYVRAKAAGDSAVMRRVAEAYVPFMERVLAFFEARSVDVLGREIPQVLLLHANEINADHFGALAAMIRRRGYRFVPLAEALDDPAYGRTDRYVGRQGLSWIHRWAIGEGLEPVVEPREPDWLSELRRRYSGS